MCLPTSILPSPTEPINTPEPKGATATPPTNKDGVDPEVLASLQRLHESHERQSVQVRGVALSYLSRGWKPIPVPRRKKGPVLKGWQGLRLTDAEIPTYFSWQTNVGVLLGEPSGGLIDVDLDCPEAMKAAQHLLPETDAIFGRKSKLDSHWLYVVDTSPKSNKFLDIKSVDDQDQKTTLVELRGTGAQTVMPTSTHPSGEQVEWNRSGEPGKVTITTLSKAVGRVAVAAILARHWPGEGSRQDAVMALAGGLARCGWDHEEAEGFITALCDAAGDEETSRRLDAVQNTFDKVAKGEDDPTTGWPTLVKLLGTGGVEVVDKVKQWLSGSEPRTNNKRTSTGTIEVIDLTALQPMRTQWLWPNHIPRGGISVLDGNPGDGKTLLYMDMAARVTRGEPMFGEDTPSLPPSGVMVFSSEDDLQHTILPRLKVAGADLSKVVVPRLHDRGVPRPLSLPADLVHLEKLIAEKGVALVVFDPFFAFLSEGYDSHKDADVRRALYPISLMAERTQVAVLFIRHMNKRNDGPALYRGGGSIAIAAAARAAMILGRDPEDPEVRVLASAKTNLGPKWKSLAFRVRMKDCEMLDHQENTVVGKVPYVEWDGETDLTENDVVTQPSKSRKSKRERAVEWLKTVLAGGPLSSEDLVNRGQGMGFAEKTLDRARAVAGVTTFQEGGKWYCRLGVAPVTPPPA